MGMSQVFQHLRFQPWSLLSFEGNITHKLGFDQICYQIKKPFFLKNLLQRSVIRQQNVGLVKEIAEDQRLSGTSITQNRCRNRFLFVLSDPSIEYMVILSVTSYNTYNTG